MKKALSSLGTVEGCLVPSFQEVQDTSLSPSIGGDGDGDQGRGKGARKAFLDGNFVRRALKPRAKEYCIWDNELPGFGLRVQPSGRHVWFVRLRHRDKHRRIRLGAAQDVDAAAARAQARRLLAEVALDGLPKREGGRATPIIADFVSEHWRDIARYWKPSTEKRNRQAWDRDLEPAFGMMHLSDIATADITRWRDDCSGEKEARFNRAIPVLASLLKYAELLHFRRKGSNPCRGAQRYRRTPCERYLSPLEYRRLGAALRDAQADVASEVAIVRLLLFTGARVSEIRDLEWDWVRPPHLFLPDSKTGPKTIWLNRQAAAILNGIPRRDRCPFVFPKSDGSAPINVGAWWTGFRRTCGIPDVRLHDLRHSFASTAIMDNVPLATIGKLLGHALPETTAKYAHLADDHIGDAAVRVSGALAQLMGLGR